MNRPTAKVFKDPVISAIADLSGCQSGTGVDPQDAIEATIILAGYDPKDCPHPIKGRNGLRRIVGFAFRNQRAGYCGKKVPMTQMMSGGLWALTPAGIIHAQSLSKPSPKKPSTEPSLTHQYLEDNLPATLGEMRASDSGLHRTMVRSISHKMPITATAGESEDMVQNYYLQALEADAFKKRMQQNNPPTFSTVGTWATRKGITEIRRRAQDAHCKGMFGCLTDKERKDKREDEARRQREGRALTHASPSDKNVVKGEGGVILEMVDTSGGGNPDSQFNLDGVWEDIEQAIKDKFPTGYQRRINIAVGMLIEGDDVQDTAKKEGVSEHRAATLRSEVKVTLRTRLQGKYHVSSKKPSKE